MGVFDTEKNKEKEKKLEERKSKMSPKENTQNAYMLFYRKKKSPLKNTEEDNSESEVNAAEESHVQLFNTIQTIQETSFVKSARKDLEKELLTDCKYNVLRNQISQLNFRNLTLDSILRFIKLPIFENRNSIIQAFSLEVKYLLCFLMRYDSKESVDQSLNGCADSVFQLLSGESLSKSEQKLEQEAEKIHSSQKKDNEMPSMTRLEEPSRADLMIELSLAFLKIILEESVKSQGSDGPENPIMILVSSREEIYLSQGFYNSSIPVYKNNRVLVSKQKWLAEIILKSISNLILYFNKLTYPQKRTLFDFLKLVIKTILIFKVNSATLLTIINEAAKVKEIAIYLHRYGFIGVLSHISPMLFQSIEKHRLGGVLSLENYFSSHVLNQNKFDICENILEYISNFHCKNENEIEKSESVNEEINEKDSSHSKLSKKGYFNFRKNYLYKRKDLALNKEKFGNSYEKKLKRLKKEFRAQVLQTAFTFFRTLWGGQRLAKIGNIN